MMVKVEVPAVSGNAPRLNVIIQGRASPDLKAGLTRVLSKTGGDLVHHVLRLHPPSLGRGGSDVHHVCEPLALLEKFAPLNLVHRVAEELVSRDRVTEPVLLLRFRVVDLCFGDAVEVVEDNQEHVAPHLHLHVLRTHGRAVVVRHAERADGIYPFVVR